MSDPHAPSDFSAGPGVSAHHDVRTVLPLFVAPSTGGERNTIRFRPVPIACVRLNPGGFAFDSSFVAPEMAPVLAQLGATFRAHPGAPLSVFGHADPVGDDAYNKQLSGRRATSVYALLTRRVDLWEALHSAPHGGDEWGPRVLRTMLGHLRNAGGTPYLEAASGSLDGATRAFQKENDLAVDGDPGPKTRARLFRAYMDVLCALPDGTSYEVPETGFLGGGEDPDGKGAYQGCGELNPVLLFAKAEASARAAERDERNGINRRVLVFFFRAGTQIPPSQWPCPRAEEDGAGCKAQLWPDGEARRRPGDAEREYRRTRDTFACRFYDGFARRSPCEGVSMTTVEINLHDDWGEPARGAHYRVTVGGDVRVGQLAGSVLTLKRVVVPADCEVEWNPPEGPKLERSGGDARWKMTVHLDVDTGAREEDATRRLHNLGYPRSTPLAENLAAFQADQGLEPTGALDDATEARIAEVHAATARA